MGRRTVSAGGCGGSSITTGGDTDLRGVGIGIGVGDGGRPATDAPGSKPCGKELPGTTGDAGATDGDDANR